ncbi:CBS domain-containing membrane protein [Fulvimarina manganoxydans]|uniref:CBS domain-containing membrane protein n=1 Tax=Fulvimarina manganoxydans TaxID=937218 RepID=A0A1W2DSC6_9HYPH|nr:HPP family protein [Fulvimarina manganoxydans]SMC99942.1 CBS domain-containing membrane protein [Fulvimarina manganoxydans]
MLHSLQRLVPQLGSVSRAEQLRSSIGALFGIAITAFTMRLMLGPDPAVPLLVAPMGASAVLLFAVPSGPLSQPWSILGGNLSAALIGITCRFVIPDPLLAAAVAVCLSIGAMFLLRCLHPPGGAVAVTTVLAGPVVDDLGYMFAFVPIGVNSLLLLLVAIAFHNLTGHRYPHLRPARATKGSAAGEAWQQSEAGFTLTDLKTALRAEDHFVDIDLNDLASILAAAQREALRRRAGDVLCQDIMMRHVVSVPPSETLANAWHIMETRALRALPVTEESGRVLGLLRPEDFVGAVGRGMGRPAFGASGRLKRGMDSGLSVRSAVKTIMAPVASSTLPETPVAELVPLLALPDVDHWPVCDEAGALVGLIARADVLAALFAPQLNSSETQR